MIVDGSLPGPGEVSLLIGGAAQMLRRLADDSIDCVVTSPPYWRLRDYGVPGQIGMERTVHEWVAALVAVFGEVRRVLNPRGTVWVNLGDTRIGGGNGFGGLKAKELAGAPWRFALAMSDAGWWLRQEIIWHKPNPMPESVGDRCTLAHEHIFLFTKSARYFFDGDTIMEPASGTAHARGSGVNPKAKVEGANSRMRVDRDPSHQSAGRIRAKQNRTFSAAVSQLVERRNARSVWTFPVEPYAGAHYATFPRELPRRCILSGSPSGGLVLDPFGGSGTTAEVALELGRRAVLIDLDARNADLISARLQAVQLSLIN